jgi:hypothetical protein
VDTICQVEADRFFVWSALGASLYLCRCLEAIKEAVLANGNAPEWTGTEQGLSKRRERVKYNNIVAFLAAVVGGRDVRIEKVRWPPPGRINC